MRRNSSLVEFRQYRPVNFINGTFGALHWTAIVTIGYDRLQTVDLGLVNDTLPLIASLVANDERADAAATTLFERLIEPLHLDAAESVILAPDGALHLLPFHRLQRSDGRMWTETTELRVVQTGRDLLRPKQDRPGKGLLALGGIDFDGAPIQMAAVDSMVKPDAPALGQQDADRARSLTEDAFRDGVAALPGSADEVREIASLYRLARKDEPVTVWSGAEASEVRLKALDQPPRVLHLATHGFYRAPDRPTDRPMLLSGITLAGANRAIEERSQDGILYALEAQDLNLEGTELVVLSACKTAQGQIDYGEGVYGLVRALRTAGAKNVLVTLRPVGDQSASRFMQRYYRNWLAQSRSDPALALQQTQRDYIDKYPGEDWTPFVLVGG